jgi:hypothetical protein
MLQLLGVHLVEIRGIFEIYIHNFFINSAKIQYFFNKKTQFRQKVKNMVHFVKQGYKKIVVPLHPET